MFIEENQDRKEIEKLKKINNINYIIASLRELLDATVRRKRYNEHADFGIKRMNDDHNNTNGFQVDEFEVCRTPNKYKSTSVLE